MVFHVVKNIEDYYKQLMDKKWNDKLIICYFTATWCGPCRMISPDITKLGDSSENILVLKIDVDDCEEVAGQCSIDCMPTFRFHLGNNLEPTKKLMGADKNSLFSIIGDLLKYLNEMKVENTQDAGEKKNVQQVKKNTDVEVPYLYNPIPNHKLN
jgi:thioredoxin 1